MATVPKDKLLHSFYGTLIYTIIAFFNAETALISVLLCAIGKEAYDQYQYSGFDIYDIGFTVVIPALLYLSHP